MICQPCRDGVHRGDPNRHHISTPLCPGGTWCACQHRTTRTTRTNPEEKS